jgi:hypothetical protein
MIVSTKVIVFAGVIGAILLGLGMTFDATALFILGLIVVFGAIGIGAAEKIRKHSVAPSTCPACGGLLSPHAPYCKHCGERVTP